MGDLDDLDEINLRAELGASKNPSTKRIRAAKQWGLASLSKSQRRPKWRQQLHGLRQHQARKP